MCIYEHLLYIQNAFVKNVYTGSKHVISRDIALVYTNKIERDLCKIARYIDKIVRL